MLGGPGASAKSRLEELWKRLRLEWEQLWLVLSDPERKGIDQSERVVNLR